jgi:hypothetical protein
LSDEKVLHEREAYGILDLFGDFGGVQYVLMLIGSIIIGGTSEFMFNLKAIQKLYLAKT